jgi:hypothetical protein
MLSGGLPEGVSSLSIVLLSTIYAEEPLFRILPSPLTSTKSVDKKITQEASIMKSNKHVSWKSKS